MRRDEQLAQMARQGPYDVVVIGGGATGLGVAVDAASRGYSTLLLEARDFAQGTSSRSTKLIHGGVRYLEQGDIKLVRQALHERGLLLRNAPHLAHELRFLVPTYRRRDKLYYGAGLTLYDLLAGRLGLSPVRFVGREDALNLAPTIRPANLRGGVIYSDAQFDDARLAISLARTAANHGATLLNHAPVQGLIKKAGRVAGALYIDLVTGQKRFVLAGSVVNATGVFTDTIRRMDDPSAAPIITASQGIHIVLDRSFLPGRTGVLVPKTDDGRVIFIIPWQGRTLIGTTDTELRHPPLEPTALDDEVNFVLRHIGKYLSRAASRSDVLSVFAGIRPLVRPQGGGGPMAKIGRDHALVASESGLVTITGGKWTTYRRMAEDAVDRVTLVASLPRRRCRTERLPLFGASVRRDCWREFGATAEQIADYEARYPGMLHADLPYSRAMAAYVIDHEMPVRLEDVLSRRLRALVLDARAAVEVAPVVAEMLAARDGRDATWVRAEVEAFRALAEGHYMVGV